MELSLETVDPIAEFSLRRWARENFVPPTRRNADWHPLVLEEMEAKDAELEGLAQVEVSPASSRPLTCVPPVHSLILSGVAN